MNPTLLRALLTACWVATAFLVSFDSMDTWLETAHRRESAEWTSTLTMEQFARLQVLRQVFQGLGAVALALGLTAVAGVLAIGLVVVLSAIAHVLMHYGPLLRFIAWGPETLRSRWLIDIRGSGAPDTARADVAQATAWTLEQVAPPEPWWKLAPFGRLRHSMYEDVRVPRLLGNWISARMHERTDL